MLQSLGKPEVHMALDVMIVSGSGQQHDGCLLLTSEVLFVVSISEDTQQQAFPVTEIDCLEDDQQKDLLKVQLKQQRVPCDLEVKDEWWFRSKIKSQWWWCFWQRAPLGWETGGLGSKLGHPLFSQTSSLTVGLWIKGTYLFSSVLLLVMKFSICDSDFLREKLVEVQFLGKHHLVSEEVLMPSCRYVRCLFAS